MKRGKPPGNETWVPKKLLRFFSHLLSAQHTTMATRDRVAGIMTRHGGGADRATLTDKPMCHAGDQVIRTGKRCMDHYHRVMGRRLPRMQPCSGPLPAPLVTWDRLPAELRVIILMKRNRMRHNAQIIIYRNVVRWMLYTRAWKACDAYLDGINDGRDEELVPDFVNKVIVRSERTEAVLFWLGVPLSYITDVDLTDDDLEGYEIFEEFTFHIEPSFLNDDRNLHVIDWHGCMGGGPHGIAPGVYLEFI
jgi:hypothetical protein